MIKRRANNIMEIRANDKGRLQHIKRVDIHHDVCNICEVCTSVAISVCVQEGN